MRKTKQFVLTTIAFIAMGFIHSASLSAALKSSPLDQLFRINNTLLDQGIEILRVSDGKILYSHNSTKHFSPASVAKLVTAASILHYFGPTHRFKTKVWHSGSIKSGLVDGDIIFEGDGDPLFITEALWQLAADLRHLGLKSVNGNLIIDNSIFQGEARDQLRLSGVKASNNAYDAPVTAMGVNFNTLAVAVVPGEKVGDKAKVNLDPLPVAGVVFDNRLVTVASGKKAKINVTRVSTHNGGSKIILAGKIPLDSSLRKVYRSVNDPVQTSGEIIRAFLKDQGITIKGKVVDGQLSQGSKLLHEVESETVATILKSLNLFSNNYIADVMVKRLGAEFRKENLKGSAQNSYADGMLAVDHFLKNTVGIQEGYTLENGSGLSTNNRMTAKQFNKLLLYMAKNWSLFPDFIASLPNAGLSGTLEDRFSSKASASLQGQLRAKTGTLTSPYSVSAIAGYTQHPEHGLIAFTVIQNGIYGKKQVGLLDLRDIQDRSLAALEKYL